MIISPLKERKKFAKIFYKNSFDYNKNNLFFQASKCIKLILQAKTNKIAKMSAKLDNPYLALKTYWSIVSRFIKKRKISTIPLVLVNGKFVSDFQVKSEHFNYHFAPSCTPVKTSTKVRI